MALWIFVSLIFLLLALHIKVGGKTRSFVGSFWKWGALLCGVFLLATIFNSRPEQMVSLIRRAVSLHLSFTQPNTSRSDCTSSESDFKTNIYCPAYEIYNEPGGNLYEVTAEHFPVIENYLSLSYQHLSPYCMRQIHWHSNNEIAYVVSGGGRVGVVGPEQNYSLFNVNAGDAWFFPAGFLQYYQAGPDGLTLVLWFNKDSISTITVPQAFTPIPHGVFQDSFLVNDTSFFQDWQLSEHGTACPKTRPMWRTPPPTCDFESVYKFHLPCANNVGTVRDIFGNQILEAVAASFPILADNGLSFSYTLIKPGCQRVLHWHTIPGELALVLQGQAHIGLVGFPDNKSKPAPFSNFTVGPGDLWFFPTGFLQYITSIEPEGGQDFIAVLGFSYDSIVTILSAGGLKPLPSDIDSISLDVQNREFFEKWRLTNEPFSCLKAEIGRAHV